MNKIDLITKLSEKEELLPRISRRIVELFFDEISHALTQGERVELRGFCTIKVKEYKKYTARNPKTGSPVLVLPKKLPFFKAGTDMLEKVNGLSDR